jgi:ribose/xylose/arabinose/galactoside ABC-type transport system permease subunit
VGDGGEGPVHGRGAPLSIALRVIAAGPLVVLACIWIVFGILSPYFFTSSNLTNILVQSSPTALLALGALVVVMVGSLDVSLGTSVGLCTIMGALLFKHQPSLGWLVVPAMLATGLAVGIVNSFVIVVFRFGNAFIVTLGMAFAVQSLSYVESGGTQIAGVPNYLLTLANNHLAGIPGPIILVLVVGALLALVLNRVVWGRWILAIGGSSDAAGKVGIPVRRVLFSVFVIAGFFTAIAGILTAGLNDAGAPTDLTPVLLAIASVVVGGASLTGGRGRVWATLVGAVILGSITNGLTLLNVSSNWTPFAYGAVLVAAVGIEALRSTVEEQLRVRQARIQAEGS